MLILMEIYMLLFSSCYCCDEKSFLVRSSIMPVPFPVHLIQSVGQIRDDKLKCSSLYLYIFFIDTDSE